MQTWETVLHSYQVMENIENNMTVLSEDQQS